MGASNFDKFCKVRYEDVYFYRVNRAQFCGIFLSTKLEIVHFVVDKLFERFKQDTDFEMSVSISPCMAMDKVENWLERTEKCTAHTRNT